MSVANLTFNWSPHTHKVMVSIKDKKESPYSLLFKGDKKNPYPLYPSSGGQSDFRWMNPLNGRTKKKLWMEVILYHHPNDDFFDQCDLDVPKECQKCKSSGCFKRKLGSEVWKYIVYEPAETFYLFCTKCYTEQKGYSIYC